MDYYEKAFQKCAVFKPNCIALKNEQNYSNEIVFGWLSYSPYSVFLQLAVSGLIETHPTVLTQYQVNGDFCPYSSTNIGNGYLVSHWHQNTGTAPRTKFDKNGWVQITGYFFDHMLADGETLEHYKKYSYTTSNTYFKSNLPDEFDDEEFRRYLSKHNDITIYHY